MPVQCINEHMVTTSKDMVRCTNDATCIMEIQEEEFNLCLPCATRMIVQFPLTTRNWRILSKEEQDTRRLLQ